MCPALVRSDPRASVRPGPRVPVVHVWGRPYAGAPMANDRTDEPAFTPAAIEALLAPAVGRLAPNTSLSPLPYDLNAGVPDRATLPSAGLLEAMRRALDADAGAALTYGGQQGYEPLRASRRRGAWTSPRRRSPSPPAARTASTTSPRRSLGRATSSSSARPRTRAPSARSALAARRSWSRRRTTTG